MPGAASPDRPTQGGTLKRKATTRSGPKPLSEEKRRDLLAYVYTLVLSPDWQLETEPPPRPPGWRRNWEQ